MPVVQVDGRVDVLQREVGWRVGAVLLGPVGRRAAVVELAEARPCSERRLVRFVPAKPAYLFQPHVTSVE